MRMRVRSMHLCRCISGVWCIKMGLSANGSRGQLLALKGVMDIRRKAMRYTKAATSGEE